MAVFRSFWAAGFESACHVNRHGERLDMLATTKHDMLADEDYARLAEFGICTVRDGVRWPLVERSGGRYDFSSVAPMARAARRRGVEVVWSLGHYGWPDDAALMSPAFPDRFARYCGAVAAFLRDETEGPAAYTPINELSFLTWAVGKEGIIFPNASGNDFALKRQLVRAALAGGEAIRVADRRARLVYVDPVIHVVAPADDPGAAAAAAAYTNSQFESWDLLLGRREPELGGHAGAVDVMGLNYYHSNQWELEAERLRWEDEPRDPRWVPLHRLIARVHERYRLPVWLGETSHFGSGRARWIREIGEEVSAALAAGVPVEGVCLYPIIDRHDWEDRRHWHHSGLWDVEDPPDGSLARRLNVEYAQALRETQARVAAARGEVLQGASPG